MAFFKMAPVSLALVLAMALAVTTSMAGTDPHQDEKNEQLKNEDRSLNRAALAIPPLDFKPIGNGIVRYDQEGEPVTRLQDMSIRMGKEIANAILAEEAAARARGEKVPERKKRDLWAEREKEVAERRAKYGPEVTEHFTIPGTTPEISARIFGPHGRVSKDDEGNTVYETEEEIVTVSTTGETRIFPRSVVTITLTNVPSPDDASSPEKDTVQEQKNSLSKGLLTGWRKGFRLPT